jgi:hypothetical protein
MAYIKNTWVDQEVERPKTYEMVNNSDGSVTLVDSFGLVSELGTPVNADNMNHIEEGIEDHDRRLDILEGEGARADVNLSNLTEQGEKHFLNKQQITNCILEVPQRIKLELNNGVLTLKAGSEVIVPNGFEADGVTPKFDYVTVESDASISNRTTNTKEMLFYSIDTQIANLLWLSDISSGTTQPTGHQYMIWYDTANNLCKFTQNSGVTWEKYSLPVSLVTVSSTQITSIDQIFNGFGYIGSTIWVDKGVKVLIPNGRNEDGTLNNIEATTDRILTCTNTYDFNGENTYKIRLLADGYVDLIQGYSSYWLHGRKATIAPKQYAHLLDTDTNRWYNCTNTTWDLTGFYCCEVSLPCYVDGSGKITSFQPKQPFRAIDWNEFSNTPHITETYVNGTSWYRVYSDGWCEQGGRTSRSNYGSIPITFLKPFINTDYTIITTHTNLEDAPGQSGSVNTDNVGSCTNIGCSIMCDANYATNWYACGHI